MSEKKAPLATGCFDYFPNALEAIARLSAQANEQHNPGEPVHWAREKSNNHPDSLLRHFAKRGTWNSENECSHTVNAAWRALALLETELTAAVEPAEPLNEHTTDNLEVAEAGDYGTARAGDGGHATAGDCGTAVAGAYGRASAGNHGTATAGDGGTASAGNHGDAEAGDWGIASAGFGGDAEAGDGGHARAGAYGTASAGDGGTASAGDGGYIRIRYYDGERYRFAEGLVGESIKANVAYRVEGESGKLVRA